MAAAAISPPAGSSQLADKLAAAVASGQVDADTAGSVKAAFPGVQLLSLSVLAWPEYILTTGTLAAAGQLQLTVRPASSTVAGVAAVRRTSIRSDVREDQDRDGTQDLQAAAKDYGCTSLLCVPVLAAAAGSSPRGSGGRPAHPTALGAVTLGCNDSFTLTQKGLALLVQLARELARALPAHPLPADLLTKLDPRPALAPAAADTAKCIRHAGLPAGAVLDSASEYEARGGAGATAARTTKRAEERTDAAAVAAGEAIEAGLCAAAASARQRAGGERMLAAALDVLFTPECAAEMTLPFQPHDPYEGGAPEPACHAERTATAKSIYDMRSVSDAELENMLRLMCNIFHTDTAIVALLTGELIHIQGACGALTTGLCPKRWGFCGWSFINPRHEMVVIEDLTQDRRFTNNFFVTDPNFHLHFYVASPLVSGNGHRLGTLCILDQKARPFDAVRSATLANLAEMLVRQLERRWALKMLMAENARLQRSMSAYDAGYVFVDTGADSWRALYFNASANEQLGAGWDGQPFDLGRLLMLPPLGGGKAAQGLAAGDLRLDHVIGTPGSAAHGKLFSLHFREASALQLDEEAVPIGIASQVMPSSADAAAFGKGGRYFLVSLRDENPDTSAPPPPPLPAPTEARAGPFQGLSLGPLVGKGAFGRVYRGEWNGDLVAVKVVDCPAKLRMDKAGAEPLEASLTVATAHPGVVAVKAHARHPEADEWWLLLEFCDRGCLVDAVVKGWFQMRRSPLAGQLNLLTFAQTALEIAEAMAFMHDRDVVHGDLSGGNVMLTAEPSAPHGFRARVCDFGMARVMDVQSRIETNQYGTVTHMSPEVLSEGIVSRAADVYAFGVLMWEMATASRAWAGLGHPQVIVQVTIMQRKLALPAGLPSVLARLLDACLEYDPAKRPTFAGAAALLRAALAGLRASAESGAAQAAVAQAKLASVRLEDSAGAGEPAGRLAVAA